MLLFLDIDCILDVPSDAAGPHGDGGLGVRRLEAVLRDCPEWRVVVTSERRYRLTTEHFARFFTLRLRHRLIGTTPLYDRRRADAARTREDEIADHLARSARGAAPVTEWVALDRPAAVYRQHAHRVVRCESFTAPAAAQLRRMLLSRSAHASAAPPAAWPRLSAA